MLQFVLFIIGFFLLVRGAEWLLDGSAVIAKRLGINDLLIGLTLVAFGTSLPELIVNLFASESGSSGIAVGNILGSNAANTLLILGIVAIMKPLRVHRVVVWREVLFNVMAISVLFILAADSIFLGSEAFRGLDRIDGLVLICFFIVFLYYAFGRSTFAPEKTQPILSKKSYRGNRVIGLFGKAIVGSLALYLGGMWIVDGAVYLADVVGVAEGIIGTSIVAIGTSLPELAASVLAVKRGNTDIAVGNVVGSNLFNILWVLGLSATIRPLVFDNFQLSEVVLGIAIAVILFVSVGFGKFKHQISAFEGQLFLAIYLLYLVTLPLR